MTIKKGSKKADIERLIDRLKSKKHSKGINAYKYCGVINLAETPTSIQKKLRGEWE